MRVDWSSACALSRETLGILNVSLPGWWVCEVPGVGLATSSPWAVSSLAFQMLDPIWPKPWHPYPGKMPSFPLLESLKSAVHK